MGETGGSNFHWHFKAWIEIATGTYRTWTEGCVKQRGLGGESGKKRKKKIGAGREGD